MTRQIDEEARCAERLVIGYTTEGGSTMELLMVRVGHPGEVLTVSDSHGNVVATLRDVRGLGIDRMPLN